MKVKKLDNDIVLIYEKSFGEVTSFSIAFDAGAIKESNEEIGLAHVVEHMVFKGTAKRDEKEINRLLDETFGFNNAMTNFPYAVYYGSCLKDDFEKALEIYSDIVINPIFPEEGFKEEIDIICQELKDWKNDLSQYCEDELFYNSFNNRRIKELIIGKDDSIKSFSKENVEEFYYKNYNPKNCTISVVSSFEFKYVYDIVNKYFSNWKNNSYSKIENVNNFFYEKNNKGIFVKMKKDMEGAKIQYLFPIDDLNQREIKALRLFNLYFGEGTSSILYESIRTKNGLAYDIGSKIKNEKGIKLFTIYGGVNEKNINKTLKIINEEIDKIKERKIKLNKDKMHKLCKTLKLKWALSLEQSIRLSLNLAVYNIMYNDFNSFYEQLNNIEDIKEEEIIEVASKILKRSPSIQIISSLNN